MEYHGNLYAKVGGKYFKLDETSDDIDKLKAENKKLKLELSKLYNSHGVRACCLCGNNFTPSFASCC